MYSNSIIRDPISDIPLIQKTYIFYLMTKIQLNQWISWEQIFINCQRCPNRVTASGLETPNTVRKVRNQGDKLFIYGHITMAMAIYKYKPGLGKVVSG